MADTIPTAEEMTASKFLSSDLLMKPAEVVTITKIRRTEETFDAGKKDTVNAFSIKRQDGTPAAVLFPKTNVYACRVLFGDDTKTWIGKKLTLIVDQDLYANETVDCIRISGSEDASADRLKEYAAAFNHRDGRPRKLIKRLKVLCAKLKRVEPDLTERIATMKKTLNENGVADDLILAVVSKTDFAELTAEDLAAISAWWAKNQTGHA